MTKNSFRLVHRRLASISPVSVTTLIAMTGVLVSVLIGCKPPTNAVTVYCSVDEPFARQIFDAFEKRSGIRIRPVFDSEAGKTTALVNRIRAERDRPRADVLFSGELFNTILLGDEGLLEVYNPSTIADVPDRFRDPQHRWTAIGLRGRVLAFATDRVAAGDLPTHWRQLAQPRFAKRLAIANPLFGTTRGHVAAMVALWGDAETRKYLSDLSNGGVLVVDGNSAAVRAVIDGRADYCMTDTDDVWVAQRDGAPISVRYLDMGGGGTLWIPSSIAMIKGARNRVLAGKLIDYLASAEVEQMLARSRSRNIPVRPRLRRSLVLPDPIETRIDYIDIAAAIDSSTRIVKDILLK
jgi:iron(III) transport system substrate-binding protein